MVLNSTWTPVSGDLSGPLVMLDSLDQFSLDQLALDHCVQLAPSPTLSDRCELEVLSSRVTTNITSLVLVSSCPRWEVVGDLQYLLSLQGTPLQGCSTPEMQVFSAELQLNKGYSKLVLRLPPAHTQPFWVFSLQVVTTEVKVVPSMPIMPGMGHFDLSCVDTMLEGGCLSERAGKFKNIFDNFQASHTPPVNNPGISSAPKMEDLLANPMLMQTMLSKSHKESKSEQEEESGNDSDMKLLSSIKTYIDLKFDGLQQTLLKSMDEKFKKQSNKIDMILKHLEDKG